jgi:hypothetical protein
MSSKTALPPNPGAPFKVEIGSLDDSTKVTAQFNPKELSVDKSVPWTKKDKTVSEAVQLEFTGAEARTMSMELLFDGYETGSSVQGEINKLLQLASMRGDPDSTSTPEEEKRPHHVIVTWGYGSKSTTSTDAKAGTNILPFKGVIESVQTKYTMFTEGGVPVRATCQVKFKEANKLSFKKQAAT